VPQIRGAAERWVSSVIPNGRTALRTRPLEALIIGGWVRGLSRRDIEWSASTSASSFARPLSWPVSHWSGPCMCH